LYHALTGSIQCHGEWQSLTYLIRYRYKSINLLNEYAKNNKYTQTPCFISKLDTHVHLCLMQNTVQNKILVNIINIQEEIGKLSYFFLLIFNYPSSITILIMFYEIFFLHLLDSVQIFKLGLLCHFPLYFFNYVAKLMTKQSFITIQCGYYVFQYMYSTLTCFILILTHETARMQTKHSREECCGDTMPTSQMPREDEAAVIYRTLFIILCHTSLFSLITSILQHT
jgi:hypothetical protein